MKFAGWKYWAVGSIAALTLMAGGVLAGGNVSAAPSLPVAGIEREAPPAQATGMGWEERGFGRAGEPFSVSQDLLAEALGISVEELEAAEDAAHTRAHEEVLAQAVANGELSQEQADAMQALEGLWGDRQFGMGRANEEAPFGFGTGIGFEEQDAYLAEALGITVEELEAARETARQNGLTQQVEEGTLTQEQAEELTGELKFRQYLSDELQNAWSAALEKAVGDGVLSQEEADELQDSRQGYGDGGLFGAFPGGMQQFDSGRGMNNRAPGGMRGSEGMRGSMQDDLGTGRGMRGQRPYGMFGGNSAPDAQSDTESETEAESTL